MRYRVHGANRTTGAETGMTIEAPTQEAAESLARGTLVVHDICQQPDPLDEAIAEANAHPAPEPPCLTPAPAAAEDTSCPPYTAVRVAAVVLCVLAGLTVVASVVELWVWFADPRETAYLWMGSSGVAAAGVLWILALIALTVRDIARNGVKSRNRSENRGSAGASPSL